ncbi:MAG: hypothetical protein K2F63_04930, partial [Muribaculaceae bacterium]|nr:hypothetical protein [Muribaculaceae bacterium]
MKTISTLALALMLGCSAASAQFCCTTEGKTFTYAESIPEEKIEYKSTAKVLAVETAADGVVTVRMEEKEPLPGPIPTDLTSYSVYTFNPADKVTTNVIMTADDFKTTMLEVIREQVLSA